MKYGKGKKVTPWLYMAAITVVWGMMAWFYRTADVLPLPPGHVHGWRQSDCVSLTRNFYEENLPLWEPRVHYAKEDLTGKAVGELPVLNYVSAKVMKITGFSWTAQRAVVLFFTWLSMMALFLWLRADFDDNLLAASIPLLLFTSPIFVYYGCNFLPDVPAAACALCGLAADAYSRKTDRRRYAVLSALFLALGTLMKVSAGPIWMALLAILILRFWPLSGFRTALKKWGGVLLLHLLLLAGVAAWYRYAHAYDYGRGSAIFLTEIRPYWKTNPEDITIINKQIFESWLPAYFNSWVWYVAGLAFLVNLWFTRKNKALFVLNLLVPLGSFAFLLLMYQQLYYHDYIMVVPVLAPVLVIAIFAASIWKQLPNRVVKGAFWILLAYFVVFNVRHTRDEVVKRYFVDEYGFVNYDLIGLRPKLREMGIPRTDLMIVVPDNAPNNSLVLVDQYGYTNFMGFNSDVKSIERHIGLGAKWLTVVDTTYLRESEFLRPFTTDTVLVYNEIHVFELPKR